MKPYISNLNFPFSISSHGERGGVAPPPITIQEYSQTSNPQLQPSYELRGMPPTSPLTKCQVPNPTPIWILTHPGPTVQSDTRMHHLDQPTFSPIGPTQLDQMFVIYAPPSQPFQSNIT